MRSVFSASRSSLRMAILLVLGLFSLGLGFGTATSLSGALASHDSSGTIHACVNKYTGVMRHVTDPAHCARHEQLIEWNAEGTATTIAGVVNADGTPQLGVGFTSSKIGTNLYELQFPDGAFTDGSAIPVVTPLAGLNLLQMAIAREPDGSATLQVLLDGEGIFTFNVTESVSPEQPSTNR